MADRPKPRLTVIHADESCLGNGREGMSPGGAASLIEVRSARSLDRRDLFISSPDTTNNRMALAGAIATLALLSEKGHQLRIGYVSDSTYLVKGMNEWVPAWRARGWRRKGGALQNLELWQQLDRSTAPHDVTWIWVRGHTGHPKNEYANDLAMDAARRQRHSDGLVESGFAAWLAKRQNRGLFDGYDAEQALAQLEAQLETPE